MSRIKKQQIIKLIIVIAFILYICQLKHKIILIQERSGNTESYKIQIMIKGK